MYFDVNLSTTFNHIQPHSTTFHHTPPHSAVFNQRDLFDRKLNDKFR